jgi:hypothetical protein
MNYCIQCRDTISGKTGCFTYDEFEYLSSDKPLQFKALSPVFNNIVLLFAWAKANSIELDYKPVSWAQYNFGPSDI